jgi:acyl-CoA hydrolase
MEKIVSPETVLSHLKPGMSIFLGTGAAEPRTLVKYLMKSRAGNLEDLELIQLVSFGEAISPKTLRFQKFRLKTFFAGWAMDLVKSGAVSDSRKETYRGQSLVSYALGTKDLMQWLDQNPMVEFQGIDKVFDPAQIGRNPKFNAIIPARKIDLSGKIALQIGKGNIATGPGEVLDFFRI